MTEPQQHGQSQTQKWTIANTVTMIRIVLIPLCLVLMLLPWAASFGLSYDVQVIVSLLLYIVISLTDSLDGYLARSRNEVTDFGKFMDPIADKVLVIAVLCALVELDLLPSWIPVVIVTREFLVSGLRMIVATDGVVVAASFIGKAKTFTTMIAIGLFMLMGASFIEKLQPWYSYLAWAFMIAAVVLTVWSMIDYFLQCRPYLSHEQKSYQTEASFEHASQIIPLAQSKDITIGTAESCTGGLIAGALTSVSGSSAVVAGGIVSYMPRIKVSQLKVEQQILDKEGIVSEATAKAMAEGCLKALGVDIAVSTTGVAGPTGGSKETPVGTVCLGLATKDGTVTKTCHFEGSREEVRAQAVDYALSLILYELNGHFTSTE